MTLHEAKRKGGAFLSGRLLILTFIGSVCIRAQPVVGTVSPAAMVPAAATGFKSATQPGSAQVGPGPSGAQKDPPPLQWGPVEVRPRLGYRLTYGDGIQFQPGSQLTTTMHAISPGLLLNVGEHWSFDFAATQTLYSRREFKDTLDQALGVQGGKVVGNWVLNLAQGYSVSTVPLVETARQTRLKNVSTGLNAAYAIGRSFSLGLSANQGFRFAGEEGDTKEWSTMNWLNYQGSAKLGAGVGLGIGHVDVSKAPNSNYHRFLGRTGWKISQKTGLDFDGGIEVRESKAVGASASSNPIYNLTLRYAPFDHTVISAGSGRAVAVSLFENQASDSRNWKVSLEQRLLGKLRFTTGIEQSRASFTPDPNSVAPAREDDGRRFNARIGVTIRQRGTLAISHERSRNTSNLAGFSYSSSQFGLEAAYRY